MRMRYLEYKIKNSNERCPTQHLNTVNNIQTIRELWPDIASIFTAFNYIPFCGFVT